MKISKMGGYVVNEWSSQEELLARQDQGRDLAAKLYPNDSKMENRVIQLAQGVSGTHWKLVKKLPAKQLASIIEGMMTIGFPADVPYDSVSIVEIPE